MTGQRQLLKFLFPAEFLGKNGYDPYFYLFTGFKKAKNPYRNRNPSWGKEKLIRCFRNI